MNKQKGLVLLITLALMAGTVGALTWLKGRQKLGQPGILAAPMPGRVMMKIDLPERVLDLTSTNVPGLETFIHAMISLAIAIGLMVIFLTMYTTVIERTRDIGVLKSIGATRSFIIRVLLTESAALCAFGVVAGVGLSYVVRAAFLAGFPTLSILITGEWIVRAALIAFAGAVFGASYPAWLASRKDPVEALSYD